MPPGIEPPDDSIGRYTSLQLVGRGATGTVYRAFDPVIGRTIAIKVLAVDDPELRARFAQEVRAAGTLTHQHIVAIHDFGDANGRPFIVMEYVDGRSLADMIRDRVPLTLTDKLRLMQQLCSALDYAHARGVVHRDIKPANLMVDRHGDLKVVDFGIAKLGGDSLLTRAGDVLGTLTYMSPEQVNGDVVDRRSDIFSVGVVLYEVLSSRRAFQGDTASQVLRAILNDQPVALSQLLPNLDPELDRIVRSALHKDPAQRYQSLAQLAADLARVNPGRGPLSAWSMTEAPTGTLVVDQSHGRSKIATVSPPVAPAPPVETPRHSTHRWAVPALVIALCVTAGAGIWMAVIAFKKPAIVITDQSTGSKSGAGTTTSIVTPVQTTTGVTSAGPGARTSSQPATTDAGVTRRGTGGLSVGGAEVPKPKIEREIPKPKIENVVTKPKATLFEEAKAILAASPTLQDKSRAGGLLRTACDVGENDDACLQAGLLYRDDSVVRDLPTAVQMFQRGCDRGLGLACYNLATEYARGVAVVRDDVKSASLSRQACEAGVPPACTNLGRAYRDGRGVRRDDAEARVWFEKACDGGGMIGCVDLGVALMRGVGGLPDTARAITLFQRACDAGVAAGCGNLGGAYARGSGVPLDEARASALYQRACDGGGMPGCYSLALGYTFGRGVMKDMTRAAALLERACGGDIADACQTLSQRYEQGVGVDRNPTRAAELASRAARLRSGSGR